MLDWKKTRRSINVVLQEDTENSMDEANNRQGNVKRKWQNHKKTTEIPWAQNDEGGLGKL